MAIQCNLVFLTNFDLPSIYILGMQSACSSVQQLNRIILVEDKEKNTFFTEVSSHWTWKKSNWVSNLSIITTPATKHWPEYDCGMCKHYTMTQCVVVVLMKPRFWFHNWSVHHKWLWWVACWEHWSDQSQNRKPGTLHTEHTSDSCYHYNSLHIIASSCWKQSIQNTNTSGPGDQQTGTNFGVDTRRGNICRICFNSLMLLNPQSAAITSITKIKI